MLLFPNGLCIEKNHHTVYIVLKMLFYMSCITKKCVKSQQNYLFNPYRS